MSLKEVIQEFKSTGDLDKHFEILELTTLTFLLGSEDEHLSFEMRQNVIDCYFRLKWLLSEIDKSDRHCESEERR